MKEDPTSPAEAEPPAQDLQRHQRCWDEPLCKVCFEREGNRWTKARLRSVSTSFYGAWLNALPVRSLGNLRDADALRIAVALRLGAPICEEHLCMCQRCASYLAQLTFFELVRTIELVLVQKR